MLLRSAAMSDTSNPNVVTKQSLTASMKTTDKVKELQHVTVDPHAHVDKQFGCPFMTSNFVSLKPHAQLQPLCLPLLTGHSSPCLRCS